MKPAKCLTEHGFDDSAREVLPGIHPLCHPGIIQGRCCRRLNRAACARLHVNRVTRQAVVSTCVFEGPFAMCSNVLDDVRVLPEIRSLCE
jgi:hypothetical protein